MKRWMNVWALLITAGLIVGCNDDDQWLPGDIPGEGETALYSNKQSAAVGTNELLLHYSDSILIGKDVQFGRDAGGKGVLTLCGILPGEIKTVVNNVVLTPTNDGYTFAGQATGTIGTTFAYSGKVEKKKLTLDISDAHLPANPLMGLWYMLPQRYDEYDSAAYVNDKYFDWYTCCNTVYAKVGEITDEDGEALWDPTAIPSIVPIAFELALRPVLNCIIGSVLHDITFHTDGNITATYAALPDTLGFLQMMGGQGIVRNDSDWESSPINLASYYPVDDTTLCIIPHVDMILRQIRLNQAAGTKATNPLGLLSQVKDIYALLNKWSTTGIRLNIRKNDPNAYTLTAESSYKRYLGDYIIYIDKSEVQALYAIIDIAKLLVPADVIDMPMDELLLSKGINVEQAIIDAMGPLGEAFAPMIVGLLHKFTINNLLTQISADLKEDPLQLGLWLSTVPIAAEE